MNQRGIVILGMHRSGTSLSAKIVARWGADGKEGAMIGADAGNPEGHWEYAPLVSFNNDLLRAVDSRWNIPPRDSHKELLEALAQESEYRIRALRLLQDMQVERRPWFWKDPRLSILLPFWKRLWGSVVYVVATRDPSDIAHSLKSRDGFSALTSFLLWERYLSEIMADREIQRSACFVSYELLLKQPLAECHRLCQFLDEQFEIPPSDSDCRPESMAAAVNPGLWRSHAQPFVNNPLATRAQRALYHASVRNGTGLIEESPEISSLEAGWRENLALADHLLQTAGLDQCQVFWRDTDCAYEERRSAWVSIEPQGNLQSIELALPAGQVQDRIFLRIDFSQRPGFLYLMEITVKNQTGKIIWDWDGRIESIQDLPRNQIDLCGESMTPRGCLLRLEGDDPWIEIALDVAESDALSKGGALHLQCAYLTTEKALLTIKDEIVVEIKALRRRLDSLRRLYAGKEQKWASVAEPSARDGGPSAMELESTTEDGSTSPAL